MAFTQLTEEQLDALKEVSNIGMGHAATALSQLIGERIHLHVPKVSVTDISDVPEIIGGAEQVVAGITLQVLGDARGDILLIFPTQSVKRLLTRLLGHQEEELILNEINTSTLKEVGNILASAYLSALGSLLHMTLIPSIPALAYDMAGAVVDYVLIELSKSGDMALTVETLFKGDAESDDHIKGHFFLLPDPKSLDIILGATGGNL